MICRDRTREEAEEAQGDFGCRVLTKIVRLCRAHSGDGLPNMQTLPPLVDRPTDSSDETFYYRRNFRRFSPGGGG